MSEDNETSPETNAIDTIREAVARSDSKLLKYVIPAETGSDMRRYFAIVKKMECEGTKTVQNVPITAIVALGRFDPETFEKGDTWGRAASERLSARWSHDVFDYWENPIQDKPFPHPDARGPLELWTVGGAVVCGTGNHRLIGGIAWLAAKHGNRAEFQQVILNVEKYHKNVVEFMLEKRKKYGPLKFFSQSNGRHWLMTETYGITIVHEVDGGEITLSAIWHPLLRFLPIRPRCLSSPDKDYKPFPDYILDAWKNRGWLKE